MDSLKPIDSLDSFAEVVVPRPFQTSLTYKIPDHLREIVRPGLIVQVPLGRSTTHGFVVSTMQGEPSVAEFYSKYDQGRSKKNIEFKSIESVYKIGQEIDEVFNEKDIHFFKWISDYYQIPLGEVFHSAFPATILKNSKKTSQKASVEFISEQQPTKLTLTEEQQSAFTEISKSISKESYQSFLLFGVTGSGKTEVYIRAARRTLELGKSVLVLVPEIALTPQLQQRFQEAFSQEVAVFHSGLSDGKRRRIWFDIFQQKIQIVLGARSALFSPLRNLGLVIVDEEHESSYKQEDRLRYNARDLALVKAKQHGATIVLGSATPSIETFYAAKTGKHHLLQLTERPQHRPLPHVEIVDLKEKEKYEDRILSDELKEGIAESLIQGNQSIIFVNRKGFSSYLMCQDCGEVVGCPNCSVSLTHYKSKQTLRCHYCSFSLSSTKYSCKQCGSSNMVPVGLGVERVEEELKSLFPNANIEKADADTVGNSKKLNEMLVRFRSGKTNILVGTQMIAKGHDFPNVTFVGVVLADLSLNLPDFRSAERTFQIITQVAGRSGRSEKPGRVIIQTYVPDHYVIQTAAKQDYLSFYETEVAYRKDFQYPPFTRMVQIEFRDLKEQRVQDKANSIFEMIQSMKASELGVEYLGPTQACIGKISNQYRWKILLKSEKSAALNSVLKTIRLNSGKVGARNSFLDPFIIDVDPVTTL